MKNTDAYYCRVCGLYLEESPWGQDNKTPNYEICPCCGVEFGNEDYAYQSILEYRKKWLLNGAKWFEVSEKPNNWNLEEQLKQIPKNLL